MDVTQLALTWVGWSNGEKLASTCVQIWSRPKWAQVIASQRKCTQALAKRSRKLTQVFNLRQLASPFGQGFTRWREDRNFMFQWQQQCRASLRSYCSCHENIKFISSSLLCNVLFYFMDIAMTVFLTLYRRFPKIFQNCFEGQTKFLDICRRLCEDFPRLSRKARRCFDHTPTNLSTIHHYWG